MTRWKEKELGAGKATDAACCPVVLQHELHSLHQPHHALRPLLIQPRGCLQISRSLSNVVTKVSKGQLGQVLSLPCIKISVLSSTSFSVIDVAALTPAWL